MTITEILCRFRDENDICTETISSIQNDESLRKNLINYTRQNRNRLFASALLDKFIAIRELPNYQMPFEDLMLACYNLGINDQVEDCLKIWKAKTTDFDTYGGLDVQLVVFAGLTQTIDFLREQADTEATAATSYILSCAKAGDFDHLQDYFLPENLPWYV